MSDDNDAKQPANPLAVAAVQNDTELFLELVKNDQMLRLRDDVGKQKKDY